jgi:cell shape-determining protein MreC
MPWKPPAASNLQRENDALKTTICCLRRELENKQGAVQRLEVLLCERLTRIDQLVAQVDQLRHQNKKLDVPRPSTWRQRGMTTEPAQAQSQA